jgi:small subunit ribosomal protein S16
MLKIRLQRVGRKHEPSFRLVLTESKNSTKSGRLTEVLGNYDPRKSLEAFKVDRVKYWVAQGAGLTGTVNNLLIKKGIIRGKKVHVGTDNVVKEKPVEEKAPAKTEPAESTEEASQASSEEAAPAPEAPSEAAPETQSQ